MNPELRRNLWLELSPRRITLMTVMLALVIFAAAIGKDAEYRPAAVAEILYFFIVVFWGTRNAALAVVGEIRDRTWDGQRLSALTPSEMTWGKLFGATAYNWYGGFLLLGVILVSDLAQKGAGPAVLNLVYLVAVGVVAQATSLLASLVAIRRRQRHTRLEVFGYQILGLIAASVVWDIIEPNGLLELLHGSKDTIVWWGQPFNSRLFLVVSLVIFTNWIIVGCHRAMRVELQMRNGPLVWLGFLAFMGIYVAGFDAWLSTDKTMAEWTATALRLGLAASTFGILTYLMVLLEPKDIVRYRWIGAQFASGKIGVAFWSFQAWMFAWIATVAVSVALAIAVNGHADALLAQAFIASALGFLTRDVALFVLFQTLPGRRRGDFAALMALLALYALLPAIANSLGVTNAMPFFFPKPSDPVWFGPVVAWAEALVVTTLAITRVALGEKKAS